MDTVARMERDGFPITLWPGVPVPEPEVPRWDDGPRFEALPAEFVLQQLAALELGDRPAGTEPAVQEFLRHWGVIMRPFPNRWSVDAARPQQVAPSGDDALWRDAGEGDVDARRSLMQMAAMNEAASSQPDAADAWCWLRTAQALVETWLRWYRDDYVRPAWEGLPWAQEVFTDARAREVFGEESGIGKSIQAWPTDEEVAWQDFATWLNRGLSAWPMHATVRTDHPLFGPDHDHGKPRSPDLYAACCIQLANLISEQLPPHRCANETCGQAFILQRGGAAQGQYRTVGVLYCSPGCQRAQAQREYRRRKADRNEA